LISQLKSPFMDLLGTILRFRMQNFSLNFRAFFPMSSGSLEP